MDQNINISDLNVVFHTDGKEISALHDINIEFTAGETTALIGESGSGKSVLGMSILQLLPDSAKVSGTCMFEGENLYHITAKAMRKLRYRRLSLIPQNPLQALNSAMKIRGQLTEAMVEHEGVSRQSALTRTHAQLTKFAFQNPKSIGSHYSFQLSGGMNQRVVTCMGLSCNPDWLIADEPTKGLDAILRTQVYEVLQDAQENRGLILITHDLQLAKRLSQKVGVMYQGFLLEQGPTEEVLSNPQHPYTKGLLSASPSQGMHPIPPPMEGRKSEDSPCPFYCRCTQGDCHCTKTTLETVKVHPQWTVRCAKSAISGR